MVLLLSILSCVLAFGYDLGNGTHYATRAILALALVIIVRCWRVQSEA